MLVDCAGQLLAYPLSGARPAQLTSAKDTGTFLGAWHLPSGTYAEAAACGSTWVEKLRANGTATTLTIPGAADAGTVQPLGTYGGRRLCNQRRAVPRIVAGPSGRMATILYLAVTQLPGACFADSSVR